jgi:hypothetical protein
MLDAALVLDPGLAAGHLAKHSIDALLIRSRSRRAHSSTIRRASPGVTAPRAKFRQLFSVSGLGALVVGIRCGWSSCSSASFTTARECSGGFTTTLRAGLWA